MPWASNIIKHVHFFKIDASYKGVWPYNYCIFHGIIYNSSIPFGQSIYPIEKKELYELLFEALKYFKIDKTNFENKHVLSNICIYCIHSWTFDGESFLPSTYYRSFWIKFGIWNLG